MAKKVYTVRASIDGYENRKNKLEKHCPAKQTGAGFSLVDARGDVSWAFKTRGPAEKLVKALKRIRTGNVEVVMYEEKDDQ
jgi:hypothetical protein